MADTIKVGDKEIDISNPGSAAESLTADEMAEVVKMAEGETSNDFQFDDTPPQEERPEEVKETPETTEENQPSETETETAKPETPPETEPTGIEKRLKDLESLVGKQANEIGERRKDAEAKQQLLAEAENIKKNWEVLNNNPVMREAIDRVQSNPSDDGRSFEEKFTEDPGKAIDDLKSEIKAEVLREAKKASSEVYSESSKKDAARRTAEAQIMGFIAEHPEFKPEGGSISDVLNVGDKHKDWGRSVGSILEIERKAYELGCPVGTPIDVCYDVVRVRDGSIGKTLTNVENKAKAEVIDTLKKQNSRLPTAKVGGVDTFESPFDKLKKDPFSEDETWKLIKEMEG